MMRITLARGEDKRVRGGHPWIFSNEIKTAIGDKTPGSAVEVYDAGGSFVGTGYYNPHSLIAVRILTQEREDIDSPLFFRRKISEAIRYREAIYPRLATCRLVYGESDFLPGLVVDRYDRFLSLQFLTAGMESRRDTIIEVLQELLSPQGIVGRNDVSVRTLEGLQEKVELLSGTVPETVEVDEHGLRFAVDLLHGQKTGHFLDQKENHLLLRNICQGGNVLDCFSYSGSWGIHAASFGARSALCLDISERAVSLARMNAKRNGVDKIVEVEAVDVFERLRTLKSERRSFDVIVMDPPAFVKSKKQINEAMKGYATINRRALELLNPGGYLITCSCSYHMAREMFREVLAGAARQAGRKTRLLEMRSQAPDHPVLLAVPETEYLKCAVLQVV